MMKPQVFAYMTSAGIVCTCLSVISMFKRVNDLETQMWWMTKRVESIERKTSAT